MALTKMFGLIPFRLSWVICLLLPLALAGCADEPPPPPQSFAPLDFSYMPKIRLNVALVDVQDHSAPISPDDIAGASPVVPSVALAQLAQQRLVASGVAGTARFVIDQASIVRDPGNVLDGQLGAHLEILSPTGVRLGYAEAHVARQHIPGSEQEDERSVLYDLTRAMLNDMNAELDRQIQSNLMPWLVTGEAVPAPVMSQPLAPPPEPAVSVPVAPAPALVPVAPPAAPAPPAEAPPPPPAPKKAPPPSGYMDPLLGAPPVKE